MTLSFCANAWIVDVVDRPALDRQIVVYEVIHRPLMNKVPVGSVYFDAIETGTQRVRGGEPDSATAFAITPAVMARKGVAAILTNASFHRGTHILLPRA
jgi:hypothetical protein